MHFASMILTTVPRGRSPGWKARTAAGRYGNCAGRTRRVGFEDNIYYSGGLCVQRRTGFAYGKVAGELGRSVYLPSEKCSCLRSGII